MRTKRLICMLLTICMLLSLMPAAAFAVEVDSEMPFTDVKESDWFYDAVQYVYDNGLMNGTGDDKFSPNLTITRGMIVTILHRLEGTPEAEGKAFADVPKGEYYSAAVAWASFAKIVEGYDTGLFAPNDAITREQMATILYRYVQYKGYSATEAGDLSGFPDGGDVSSFALKAVKWAVGEKLIKGADGGMLMPAGTATRAQAATILMRFCEGVVPKTHTVTFDFNYDGKIAIVSALEGETIEEPAAPERADFTFGGWYTDADGKTAYDFNKAITEDVTLYAKWTANEPAPTPELPKTYTVSFDYNYDEMGVYKEVAVEEGKTVGEPEAPSRSMYIFLGWTADKNGGQSFDFSTPITSDITLYAQWRIYHIPTRPTTKTYTVTFESNGGSEVASQTVEKGGQVEEPTTPTREGFAFIGWYPAPGYSEMYDFSSEIYSDATLYAKWYDTVNTADSDNDGLSDALEIEMGTNPNVSDTDGDGLSDYTELNWLNYNPLSDDTDGNGVLDKDEDPDNDGLTNEAEEQLGTNPIFKDSDFDGLSDGDEVNVYHTNPLCADTDGDGVPDGVEVMIDTDPLVAETTFATEEASGTVNELTPVVASAVVNTDAAGAGTLSIQPVSILDNPLLSHSVAGYLGSAYDFSTKGTFESATITFTYDTVLGTIGDKFQPRIYYYNEETQLLEELPNQTVEEGKVSASVEHFSTYILLNKVEFDKVWQTEIKTPQDQSAPQYTGTDIVFVIDSSGSMTTNDSTGLRKEAAKAFVDKLGENDRAAVIDFDWSAAVYQSFTSDHETLKNAINRVDSSGGTSLSNGISKAIELFTSSDYTRTDAYKYIIFLTDGDGDYNNQYTTTASNNSIVVYTIGLGSGVCETVLKAIADGTGGKYYFASTADALSDIYVDVSYETVDYTTDSNNDGISDYYTKLLSEGELSYGTSSSYLIGLIDNNSDDWDGDGLKNGEELIITTTADGKVYVKMISDPLLVDTDGDGYSDYDEVKAMNTPPMKYTSECSPLDELKNNDYNYVDNANDEGILADINAFFDWKKNKEAKELIINYFYDYASKDTIDKNQEKISKLKAREEYLNRVKALSNLIKTAKGICDTADSVGEIVNGKDYSGRAKEYVDGIKSRSIKLKGASAQANTSRKELLRIINANSFSNNDKLTKEVLNTTKETLTYIEEFSEYLGGIDYDTIGQYAEELTSHVNAVVATVGTGIGTVKSIYEGAKYMRLTTSAKIVSDGFKAKTKVLKLPSDCSDVIGVALDVADGVIDAFEISNTYGKIKANRDAYISFIDLLYYMRDNAAQEYVRDAAGNVAEMVADEAWIKYEEQLKTAHVESAGLTILNIAIDICPYTNLAKAVATAVISLSGVSSNAHLYVSCRTIKALSDACIKFVDVDVERSSNYFSYDAGIAGNIVSYIVQLAQSRIVGENYVRERLKGNDLAAIRARLALDIDKDDVDMMYKIIIGYIYGLASDLEVELSHQLPFYSDFN